ncbi:MAG: hypothetical protein ABSF00_01910 [Candidatus Bathyarchaeia archaeon]
MPTYKDRSNVVCSYTADAQPLRNLEDLPSTDDLLTMVEKFRELSSRNTSGREEPRTGKYRYRETLGRL